MDAATPPTEPAPVREDGSIAEAARRTLTVLAAHIDGFQTSLAKAEAAAERGRLAEVEAAAVPALRDTIAALKHALDAEQARNRDLRKQLADAGGPILRVLRWVWGRRDAAAPARAVRPLGAH
jgi:hypothetical protein